MKWFKRGAVIITVIYFFILYGCYWWNDHNVATSNWGSSSDIVTAVFTLLISWATTLLLLAAWLTAGNWLEQNKYKNAEKLLTSINELYFCLHEYKTLEMTNDYQVQILKNNEPDVSKYSDNGIDAFGRFGISKKDMYTPEELEFMRKVVIDGIKITNEKLVNIKDKLEHLKFKTMSAAGLFADQIIENKFELLWEINRLIMAEKDFHKTANPIYFRLKQATGYDGFNLIEITDPLKYSIYKEGVDGKQL